MSYVRSGVLAAWSRAWLVGLVSLDQVVDATTAGDAPHLVVFDAAVAGVPTSGIVVPDVVAPDTAAVGMPALNATSGPVGLRDVLVAWRRIGAPPRLSLPVPGDVRGLPGPAAFRAAALDAGEAVVSDGLGVVPEVTQFRPSSAPPQVVWRAFAVDPVPHDQLTVRDAQYDLTTAIRESATALATAGVAGSNRDVAMLLSGVRRAGGEVAVPPGHPSAAVALLSQAERLQAVLDLVADDPLGGAVDQDGITARTAALRQLATAVRRARLAAYNDC